PLVALCDARDAHHKRAVRHLDNLVALSFGVCEPVLTEACFHLPHISQRSRLRALLDELLATSIDSSGHHFRDDGVDWLTKYGDHDPDWADACLAVQCGRDRDAKVWTYDREFKTTWRRPDGSRIPLAV